MLRRKTAVCLASLVTLGTAVGVAQAHPLAGGSASPTAEQPIFAAGPGTTPDFHVMSTGFSCGLYGPTTTDSEAYAERYKRDGTTFYNDELGCVADTGPATATHKQEPLGSCVDGTKSRRTAGELVTFADGEAVIVCDAPDVTKDVHHPRGARRHVFQFVSRGFRCEATVGTGATGSTATNLHGVDSIEFDQPYTYTRSFAAITTTCVGTVPEADPVAGTAVSHELSCSQDNPFGEQTLIGYGETFTFPDRQYLEICQIPDYPLTTTPDAE